MYRALTLVILLSILSSCSRTEEVAFEHSFRIYMHNDVIIAETTGGPKYSEPLFHIEKALEISPAQSNRDAILVRPVGFTRDEAGLYYVVDEGSPRVVVFNKEGKFVRNIGGRGDGPGEFRRPRLQRLHGDILEIYDEILLRTTRFKLDGSLLEIISPVNRFRRMKALYRGLGEEIITIQFITREEGEYSWYQRTCQILTPQEEVKLTILTPEIKGERIEAFDYTSGGVPLYSRMDVHFRGYPSIILSDTNLIVSTGEQAELQIYDLFGKLQRKVVVKVPGQPVSREERAEINSYAKRLNRTEPPNQRQTDWTKLVEIKDPKAYWRTFNLDTHGYYWMENPRRWNDTVSASHKLLSPEGEYLGNAYFPYSQGIIRYGEYLVLVTNPDTGERIPTVYNILPAQEGLKYP